MSKVVIFNGSPRKNGYTSKLLAEVTKGAEAAGAQTVTFNLNDPKVRGCQGCKYCREHDGCATQDYLQPMYKEIIEADAVVLGSPIYYHDISGQAKIWLDRTFPMIESGTFKPRHPGKKFLTIFTQGNADKDSFADRINHLNAILQIYGWEQIGSLVCGGTNNPDFEISTELLEQAFQDGKRLIAG